MSDFESLGLSPAMLRALEHQQFTTATPIQKGAIPPLMTGRDLIGIAETGSGKTAAFVIPLLEKLSVFTERAAPNMPRAVILAPTRELAIQTTQRIKELSTGLRASCCTIFGGAPYKTQIQILRRGVDILVATPGRLLDHIKQGNIFLDAVEYFVLDEADRMLDLGFFEDVQRINAKILNRHQSVMFSATMSDAIRTLMGGLLDDPQVIEIAKSATVAPNLEHYVLHVPGHQKNELFQYLLEEEEPEKAIIFVRTRRDAETFGTFLEEMGLRADTLHGDKPQKVRQRVINAFQENRFDFLVATDVAARGLDVRDITHVFNMDTPVEAESYVHRIGRCARGGAHGRAFTLCGKNEQRLLSAIENLLGEKIEVIDDHPFPAPTKPRRDVVKRRTGAGPKPAQAKRLKGKRAEKFGTAPERAQRDTPEGKTRRTKKVRKDKGKPKRSEKAALAPKAAPKAASKAPQKAAQQTTQKRETDAAKPAGRPVKRGAAAKSAPRKSSKASAAPRRAGGAPKRPAANRSAGRGGNQPLRRR